MRCYGWAREDGYYDSSLCCGLCLRLLLRPPAALLDRDYLFSCDLTIVRSLGNSAEARSGLLVLFSVPTEEDPWDTSGEGEMNCAID